MWANIDTEAEDNGGLQQDNKADVLTGTCVWYPIPAPYKTEYCIIVVV